MAAAAPLTGGTETTTAETPATLGAAETTGTTSTTIETKTETPSDWRSGLTGDHASLAADKTLASIRGKDFNEVGPTLAKMVVEGQKLVGKKTEGMIRVPGKDATPEQMAAYREALGVPKNPSDYDVKLPDDAPEGLAIDPERFAGYAKVFHGMNLTNEQVNSIVGWAIHEEAKKDAAQREKYAQELDTLADTWGVDVFNRRAGEVQALVRRYASPEFIKKLDRTGQTNDPDLFKMLYPIAREFAESGVIEGGGESVESDLKSLETRLDDNRAAYLKEPEGSPRRATLLDERERLVKLREELASGR